MSNARKFRRQFGRALYLGPPMDDVSIGMAIRDKANRDFECPECGAEPIIRESEPGMYHGSFEHEDWCRAVRNTKKDQISRSMWELAKPIPEEGDNKGGVHG